MRDPLAIKARTYDKAFKAMCERADPAKVRRFLNTLRQLHKVNLKRHPDKPVPKVSEIKWQNCYHKLCRAYIKD